MSDQLSVLLRLRAETVREEQRRLADAIAALDAAEAAGAAARAAMEREAAHAAGIDADDTALVAFAAWLPRGRAAIAAAEEQFAQATLFAARARAALGLARAGERAVEELIATRAEAAAHAEAAAEQAALDEIGQNKLQ